MRNLEYSLHVNSKQLEARANHPDRAAQFSHIDEQVATFKAAGQSIISVDSKKEGVDRRIQTGWSDLVLGADCREHPHDFLGDSLGRAAPYGIYDVLNNRGTVYVGQSADTPAFAVDVIADWWNRTGRVTFPTAKDLLILADAGGSNSCRARLWNERLQTLVCEPVGLEVTVCHYPTGCSKWNPIASSVSSSLQCSSSTDIRCSKPGTDGML